MCILNLKLFESSQIVALPLFWQEKHEGTSEVGIGDFTNFVSWETDTPTVHLPSDALSASLNISEQFLSSV